MSLTLPALQATLAQQTGEVFLECLSITPDGGSTIRLVNNTQDITRSAGVFEKFPFRITGISQDEQQLPQMQITIDNIDQRIITMARQYAGTQTEITVNYDVVLSSSPNSVEYGPIPFRVDDIAADAKTLNLRVSFNVGFLNAAFPHRQFSPGNAEGV